MNNIEYLKKYYHGNLDDAIKRLEKGEPIQYIVGDVSFFGYNYDVNKDVLIPRFETEELVDNTLKYLKKYFSNPKILDLCTGSGCIGLTIKNEMPSASITLSDISSSALKVAKKNMESHQMNCCIIESDLFNNINDKFDCIISNPPYIGYDEEIDPLVKNNEPHLALYADNNGLMMYERIFSECEKYLNDKYIIAVEIGAHQKNSVIEIINKYLKNVIIIAKKDGSNRDRMIFILKNININE